MISFFFVKIQKRNTTALLYNLWFTLMIMRSHTLQQAGSNRSLAEKFEKRKVILILSLEEPKRNPEAVLKISGQFVYGVTHCITSLFC